MKRIVLITGASSGIGRAITQYLASKGNLVYAGARKEEDLLELNQMENVKAIRLDVTMSEDIKKAFNYIKSESEYVDCLINNAGVMGWGAVIDRDLDYFKSVFNVNVWGAVSMVKAFYPLLKRSKNDPVIFNMSSQGENYTLPFWAPYMMSKHAMKAFSSSLRREMMTVGIRVVGIAPGAFKSNMMNSQKKILENYDKKYHSEFTSKVVKMLGLAINKDRKREESPELIGKLIYKVMNNGSIRPRYQPGRKFLPDVILHKFPVKMVDKLVMKMIR